MAWKGVKGSALSAEQKEKLEKKLEKLENRMVTLEVKLSKSFEEKMESLPSRTKAAEDDPKYEKLNSVLGPFKKN